MGHESNAVAPAHQTKRLTASTASHARNPRLESMLP